MFKRKQHYHHSEYTVVQKKWTPKPAFLLIAWFGGLIMLGSLLLWLPISQFSQSENIKFIDALFVATSATCVTGLSTVEIDITFSFFGQIVLLILIEMGGVGVMTFANLGFKLLGKKMDLTSQAALTDSFYQNDAAREFKNSFKQMLKIMIYIQVLGAIFLFLFTLPEKLDTFDDIIFNLWAAIFHSISAFCNAGFSIYKDNLAGLNTPFLLVIIILITLGGIGHTVLLELYNLPKLLYHKKFRNNKTLHLLSLNTKIVLTVSIILVLLGTLFLLILGINKISSNSFVDSLFLSVSSRTAGFSTFSLDKLPLGSALIAVILMFIGASPGSCGGGIKTTSLAIWVSRIVSNARNDSSVNLFGYSIDSELVIKTRVLITLALLWNLIGIFVLAILQPNNQLIQLIFEQVSAFATVGSSMNLTPYLHPLSKLWIVVSMFMGRLGPLTIILYIIPTKQGNVKGPIGRVLIE